VRTSTDGTFAKAGIAPSPAIRIRPKHLVQGARHKDNVSSLQRPQHSLVSRTDSNLFQKFWSGLTAAIEHVWPPSS
jgi:hypothetical protein